jgi:tetratricopeptide (TPR) repeat protein
VTIAGAFDRFELQHQVGSGGMATVYRALDRATGSPVALKILHGRSGELTERFGQEAAVLAALTHPAVVRYVAHGSTPLGEQYLAMEWLDGETLHERLVRGPLSISESVHLGLRIADALAGAHRRGIVHRDIKPSNLFLTQRDLTQVKLLDFGLARRVMDPRRLTQAGGIMGTPMYMAPEQARGEAQIDPRADIFALGCVLFECLTGHPPFTGPTAMAVLAKICLDESLPIRQLCPGLPQDLEAALGRMLAKERDARFADAPTVAGELGEIAARLRWQGDAAPDGAVAAAARAARDTLTAGEQRVICVVLATRPKAGGAAAPAPDPRTSAGDRTLILTTTPAFDAADVEKLRAALGPYGARLERLLDGSIVVTVAGRGTPTDQAAHAARCALHLRHALPQAAITVSTGRAVLFGQLPVGDVIDRGAELLAGEARGAIRLDETTSELLEARFELGGERGRRYLLGEQSSDDAPRTLLGQTTACVGRDRELALLEGTFEDCATEPVARAVLVTAPAGLGKSRLRQELVDRLRRAGSDCDLLLGRGDAIAAGASFGLLAPALRAAAGIAAGDAPAARAQKMHALVARHVPAAETARVLEFLGELAGVPSPDDPSPALRAARGDPRLMGDQIRAAWLDWLSAACAERPVLLVLDDVQWGDRPSLQLVDAALRALRDRPLMVLALARPEIDAQFPGLWDERDVQRLTLRALTRKACQRLVGGVLGDGVDGPARDWLIERADGNPFYLEELIRAVSSGAGAALPETVVGMVQARLDMLGGDAKRALRAASVFGQSFRRSGVSALLSDHDRAGLDDCLGVLVAREVIVSQGGGDEEYVFRHALLRDAAYAMLTEGDRALGHLLAGEWLEKGAEREAIVLVEHFERGGDLVRAARWCRAAAEEALAGNDLGAAIARAERGVALGASGAALVPMRLVQAQAHFWRGEYALAAEIAAGAVQDAAAGSAAWFQALGELISALGQQGRYAEVARWTEIAETTQPGGAGGATAAQLACLIRAAACLLPGGLYDATDAILARVEAETAGFTRIDPALAAKTHAVRATRKLHSGDQAAAIGLQEAALAAAAATGDARTMCEMRANLASVWADIGQIERAEALLRQSLAEAQKIELHYVTALVLVNLSPVLVYAGRLGEARRLAMQALNFGRKQGDQRWEGAAHLYLSTITFLAGEHQGSEQRARRAVELVPSPLRPSALAALARAVLAQGRPDEALEHARRAHEMLDAVGHVEEYESLVRLVLAEALAASGDQAGARTALAAAASRLTARAGLIQDTAWRESFLTRLTDNRRTLELARAWGVAAA